MTTIGRAFVATMSIFGILLLNGCNSKRRDLLCKADLNAIMQASTEVLAKASAGEIMTGPHEFRRTPQSPEIAKFPQVIRELKPTRVVIEDGYLTIQFGGGFDHFGLKVYAKDFKAPFAEFNYGSRQIIDGLWYYDEYYSDESTRHKRKIDRWIEARVRALGKQGHVLMTPAKPGAGGGGAAGVRLWGIPGTSMSKPLSRRSRDFFAGIPHIYSASPGSGRQ